MSLSSFTSHRLRARVVYMVNMFFPSAIHHGLYPSWIKPKTKRLTFVASLQSKKGVRAKIQCKDSVSDSQCSDMSILGLFQRSSTRKIQLSFPFQNAAGVSCLTLYSPLLIIILFSVVSVDCSNFQWNYITFTDSCCSRTRMGRSQVS